MTAIHSAREELLERKSSLRLGSASPTEDELGLKEPAKLKTDSVTKCMECYISFTMLKRKHHCHACGSVSCLVFLLIPNCLLCIRKPCVLTHQVSN